MTCCPLATGRGGHGGSEDDDGSTAGVTDQDDDDDHVKLLNPVKVPHILPAVFTIQTASLFASTSAFSKTNGFLELHLWLILSCLLTIR